MGAELKIKVVTKRVKGGRYTGYVVTLPTVIARAIGIKGGETLNVRIVEANVDGREIKGVLYYIDNRSPLGAEGG
ncbi:MAG: hypothetical protein QXT64_01885 [Desulfurococcaceae archaeon]